MTPERRRCGRRLARAGGRKESCGREARAGRPGSRAALLEGVCQAGPEAGARNVLIVTDEHIGGRTGVHRSHEVRAGASDGLADCRLVGEECVAPAGCQPCGKPVGLLAGVGACAIGVRDIGGTALLSLRCRTWRRRVHVEAGPARNRWSSSAESAAWRTIAKEVRTLGDRGNGNRSPARFVVISLVGAADQPGCERISGSSRRRSRCRS